MAIRVLGLEDTDHVKVLSYTHERKLSIEEIGRTHRVGQKKKTSLVIIKKTGHSSIATRKTWKTETMSNPTTDPRSMWVKF